MKRIISILLLLTLSFSFAACQKSGAENENVTEQPDISAIPDTTALYATQEMSEEPTTETGIPEDFSFSLVYGVRGDLTYDSKTGVLVKQSVATRVEDYTTTFFFTAEQNYRIYDLIVAMDPSSYPDEYNPIDPMIHSDPSYEIVLAVTYNGVAKTITCHDIAVGAAPKDEQGERFLAVIDAITEIIYASDEWQALPEYELFYA